MALNNTVKLDDLLKEDKKKCEDADLSVMWYHGKMSRDSAEKILTEAVRLNSRENSDGMFLVRDSTASEVDFSLTFMFDSRCYHFYIQRSKEGYYSIDGGPIVHGLDKLIEHYIEAANRLPTRLTKLCKGFPPPPKVRKDGPTNILHKTVKERKKELVKKILDHPQCPDINAKNREGSTALHIAAEGGQDKVVSMLLSHGADVKMKDVSGCTPLHKACDANRSSTTVLLIHHDCTCVQEKNPTSGWTALHLAAMHGHTDCVQILLDAGGALYSLGQHGETPIDLAEKYRRRDCIEVLENYKEPPVTTDRSDWLHPELDRQGTENIFSSHPPVNGMFLIRPSKNVEGQYVLSLYKDRSVFHYEIKAMDYRGQVVHHIEDGPFHRSLELLVQYYSKFEDGLGIPLQASISTNNKLSDLSIQETYTNLTSPRLKPVLQAHTNQHKPKLPPRPPDLDSPPATEAPPTPETNTKENTPSSPEEDQDVLKVILRKNLKLGSELGEGEYGSVLKGVLTIEKRLLRKEKIDVAIKTFHSVSNVEDFKLEAKLMQSLKNDYIVQLLGVCNGPPLMLVEEFVPMGSMLDYLEDHPQKVRVKQELYLWAAQIAKGMMYLETKRLVHRDLAARNILLLSLRQVKISDFGLSRAMGTDKEYYKASKGGRWPIKWYAPESVNFGHFSHPSDVWSYGVTLWEMFSYGGAPFANMTGVEVIKFIEDGNRLHQPEKCPDAVYAIMLKCWSYEPAQRPTFTKLNDHFNEDPEYMSARELLRAVRLQHH